uniref:Uncharacterized protein n=1 Tax=Hyaloperonospora arabidopsidis (strain Emoy2) TaxID=559515 RepID=M4BW87_HYAAE
MHEEIRASFAEERVLVDRELPLLDAVEAVKVELANETREPSVAKVLGQTVLGHELGVDNAKRAAAATPRDDRRRLGVHHAVKFAHERARAAALARHGALGAKVLQTLGTWPATAVAVGGRSHGSGGGVDPRLVGLIGTGKKDDDDSFYYTTTTTTTFATFATFATLATSTTLSTTVY